jgi:ammonia channel protein AmtB
MSRRSRRFGWLLLAALLLAFPLYAAITGITLFEGGLSRAQNMASYLAHFPKFLQSKVSIAWVALLLNITSNAITISTAIGKKSRSRWLPMMFLFVGVLVMLWLGFALL